MKGQVAIGTFRHVVTLQSPGPAVPDGDGNATQSWIDLVPAIWHCAIEPATQRDLERITAGTVIAEASHILTGRWRAGVTTTCRAIFNGRVFNITGVGNPEERNIELELVAVEVVQ